MLTVGIGVIVVVGFFLAYVELNRGIPGYVGNKPEKNVVIV